MKDIVAIFTNITIIYAVSHIYIIYKANIQQTKNEIPAPI